MLADFTKQPRHLRAAHFLVRHFAPAMENHCAHFVAFAEEPDDLVLPNLKIVLRRVWPELHFFQRTSTAALPLLVRFLVRLVKVLAVVRDFANGRIGRRRNFHQIETLFARHFHGFERLHYPKLPALFVNHPDFASSNPVVYSYPVALLPEIPICDNSPLVSTKGRRIHP
jgi:hypothetical protein